MHYWHSGSHAVRGAEEYCPSHDTVVVCAGETSGVHPDNVILFEVGAVNQGRRNPQLVRPTLSRPAQGTLKKLLRLFKKPLPGRNGDGNTEHYELPAYEALSCIESCGELIARERNWSANLVVMTVIDYYSDPMEIDSVGPVYTPADDAPTVCWRISMAVDGVCFSLIRTCAWNMRIYLRMG